MTSTPTIKRGDTAVTTGPNSEAVTIVRAEWLEHPAFTGPEGLVPARRERWLHVQFVVGGGRVLMHPSNLAVV